MRSTKTPRSRFMALATTLAFLPMLASCKWPGSLGRRSPESEGTDAGEDSHEPDKQLWLDAPHYNQLGPLRGNDRTDL
jgi:hypothetical protein